MFVHGDDLGNAVAYIEGNKNVEGGGKDFDRYFLGTSDV
jgi:hypothetical protein